MAEGEEDKRDFSLEDWVAFKKDIFEEEDEKSQINVMIGWNEEESKVAVSVSERPRRATDPKSKTRASLFSLQTLQNAHSELLLLYPELRPFPTEVIPKTQKNFLFRKVEQPVDIAHLCNEIQAYLTEAFATCGKKVVFNILFNEEEALGNFEESRIDLKVKGLENVVEDAFKELEEILKLKENAGNMLQTHSIYILEEAAVQKIITELGTLYNLQLSQFLDEQEFSEGSIRNLEGKLKNPVEISPEIRKELEDELERHQELRLVAGEAIQQLYQEYFRRTSQLLQDQLNRMEQDQQKYGSAAFRLQGLDRLLDLKVKVNEEKLKLVNVMKVTRDLQRNNIKVQLARRKNVALQESLYEMELSCCQIHLELLEQQESVLKAQKAVIEKDLHDQEEEGIFFDAPETSEECESIRPSEPLTKANPELLRIHQKLNSVYRKRATIRNKKKKLMAERQNRVKSEKAKVQTYKKHHSIQIKREEHKRVEEDKKDFVDIEREKALQRLREYRKKCEASSRRQEVFQDEDGQPLPPPPPGSRFKYARSQNQPLPPPPLEFYINNTPGIDYSIMADSGTSSVFGPPQSTFRFSQHTHQNGKPDLPIPFSSILPPSQAPVNIPAPPPVNVPPPPPPPPPPVIPPPPPPPPPPVLFGSDAQQLKLPKKEDGGGKGKVVEQPVFNKPDLTSIQNALKNLKKVPHSPAEGSRQEVKNGNDLNSILRSMVDRIRPNISDSDTESESNFDFD